MLLAMISAIENNSDKDFMLDIYQRYNKLIRKTIYKIVKNSNVIDDLTNDVFIKNISINHAIKRCILMVHRKGRYVFIICIALLLSGCSGKPGVSVASTSIVPPTAEEASASVDISTSDTDKPAMTDYLTYKLPDGLTERHITGSIGNSDLFIYKEARIEDNPSVPREWLSAGGVMFYGGDMFYQGNLISFENGEISSVKPLWEHSKYLAAPERVPNCEANASIVEAKYDIYTTPEIESAKAAGNPIPEEKQTISMWFVFFAKEDGYKAYALFLNENHFSKNDIIKLAQSVHLIDGAFNFYDPNLQYSQEYIAGTGNIQGGVDTKSFADISSHFEIGANRYGYAVFKNPDAAYARLTKDYKAGINLIQREFKLPPLSQVNYEVYKNLGWQVTSGTEEEQKQANFVTDFMDIYENCVQVCMR